MDVERTAARHESDEKLCPRCGGVIPPQKMVGRPRVWCSEECRKAGWAARANTRSVEGRVFDSPEATEKLLLQLAACARRGELNDEQWGNVRAAAAAFSAVEVPA